MWAVLLSLQAPTSRTQLSFSVCFGTLQSFSVECHTCSCTQEGQAMTYGEHWVIPVTQSTGSIQWISWNRNGACEPEPHSYSALIKRTKRTCLKSLAFQCKIKWAVHARSLSYLGRGHLRTSKRLGSWITPEFCKDGSLWYDKGGFWLLEPSQNTKLYFTSRK